MEIAFAQKTAKIVVCDPAGTRRFMLMESIRQSGFKGLQSMADGKDLATYLEIESPDWVIMPLLASEKINALHILKIATTFPRFRHMRISLTLQEDELDCLPLAFEHGLMSWHPVTSIRDVAEKEFKNLLSVFEKENWDATRVSAFYLRKYLETQKHYHHLLTLGLDLCQLYPGVSRTLLSLGEAQAWNGSLENAAVTFDQVTLLDPELSNEVAQLRQKFLEDEEFSNSFDQPSAGSRVKTINALGISNCVVIDSDSAMHYALSTLLKDFGVTHIHTFTNGMEAWDWLKDNPEPGLIISEWRLPNLPGPLLVQRIRGHQFLQVPIVIVSSLIKSHEVPLVQEMGVASVIEKPFNQSTVIRTLAWVLQQQRHPTEQHALERRMKQLLELNQKPEAHRLFELFKGDARISEIAKNAMEAEFAYHSGEFERARDLAIEAIKAKASDTLMLFNLLGKCLLKTGQHEFALKCFSKAQSISPCNIERLCLMAEIHHDSGDHDAENGKLEQAAKIDASSPTLNTVTANLALLDKNHLKAKDIMAELDSVSKLLALMNNRAISMIRSGQFEAGIELYKDTLSALPGDWSRQHDAVSYNLGLAFARYGDLENSSKHLELVRDNSPSLKRKAVSLLKRLKMAQAKGIALALSEEVISEGQSDLSKGISQESIMAQMEVRRGDICCYLIYRALDLANTRTLSLLANPPTFVERKPTVRDSTMIRK